MHGGLAGHAGARVGVEPGRHPGPKLGPQPELCATNSRPSALLGQEGLLLLLALAFTLRSLLSRSVNRPRHGHSDRSIDQLQHCAEEEDEEVVERRRVKGFCPFSGPDGRGFLQLPDAFRRVCSTSLPPRRHPRWHSRRRRRSCKRRRVSPHPSRPVLAEGAEAGESEAMSRMRLVDWRHPSTPISRVMEMVDARRRKMRAERGNRLALLRRAAGRGRGGATKPA